MRQAALDVVRNERELGLSERDSVALDLSNKILDLCSQGRDEDFRKKLRVELVDQVDGSFRLLPIVSESLTSPQTSAGDSSNLSCASKQTLEVSQYRTC